MDPSREIKKLSHRHLAIMELWLAGVRRKDIAARLGYTPSGVRMIVESPLFQEEAAKRREGRLREASERGRASRDRALEALEEASEAAAMVHVGALGDPDVRARQASAEAILNRVFGRTGEASGEKLRPVNITVEQLQMIQVALREASGPGQSHDERRAVGYSGGEGSPTVGESHPSGGYSERAGGSYSELSAVGESPVRPSTEKLRTALAGGDLRTALGKGQWNDPTVGESNAPSEARE
jgi:hypothetical protein